MLAMCDCGENPVCNIPQNALTPTDIYQQALRGHNVEQFAYVPPENPEGDPDTFDVPLENLRGTDPADLFIAEQDAKERIKKFKKSSQHDYDEVNRFKSKL